MNLEALGKKRLTRGHQAVGGSEMQGGTRV
jgi:hypothetical protein